MVEKNNAEVCDSDFWGPMKSVIHPSPRIEGQDTEYDQKERRRNTKPDKEIENLVCGCTHWL